MKNPHYLRAILFALANFTIWVVGDACMKLVGETPMPPYEILALQGLCGVITMLLITAPRGETRKLLPLKPGLQMGRAMLTIASNFMNVIALQHLPLTLFYVTVFTAPFVIALLAALLLKENLNWQKMLAIVVGFAGVVIAIAPWNTGGGGDWIGYAAASTSVAFFAANAVWMRVMTQSETPESMTIMTSLLELIGCGALMLMLGATIPTWQAALFVIGMGVASTVGNLWNFLAFKYGPAALVMQFHYTQIISGALLGFLIWHEVPTSHLVLGAFIIIGAGIYMVRQAQPKSLAPPAV